MTAYQVVYDAFLAQIQDDEWSTWEDWEREEDWQQLLLAAIPWFKFPRISLTMETDGFTNDLTNNEIQVIVGFMKAVWLDRVILSWENLRPLYSERDFSPAMTLKQLDNKHSAQLKAAKQLEAVYYRSVNEKSYPYSNLAGG